MALVPVSQRNNHGVNLLIQGHADPAAQVFRQALTWTRQAAQQQQDVNAVLAVADPAMERTLPMDLPFVSHDFVHETSFTMYCKAFSVEEHEDDLNVLSAVLLYNIAVSFHAMGVSRGSAQNLHRASHLYTRAYSVLATLPHQVPLRQRGTLLMASVNNLGHVCALLGDDHGAATSFHQLRSLTIVVRDTTVGVTDLSFFLMAVITENEDLDLLMAPSA
mmetsp:Transcript_22525/g.46965  ORF Transcript_22525/g.46965 Transcript_22525/m.46965 type:complete len:219 (-) Transcript_22525:165-821(-)|eukprot:CAMPEP_0172447536 /NCGR_PEP_ID=MMETSP1065-20121228/6824_1 /TAXON_ID=265537 /ORGANISM="Amphiprora paludosa, Strain CCMP125" /LENGTH=218 /DNA_ID=CAMNT_0013198859 /DNA_START=2491 /DNA_END=3147 /DNA_ORIENTATION=+